MIDQERYERLLKKEKLIETEMERLKKTYVGTTEEGQKLLEENGSTPLTSGSNLAELVSARNFPTRSYRLWIITGRNFRMT